ncbi:MAG: RNA polymerase sigma factor [Bacteriovoracaceae bacterium]|nr:RNA polymerase sigma factor [Bacteroidota bacterium]
MNKRSHMAQTDRELIARSKAGDSSAFEQLIFRYDKDVLNIAARYTQCADDAKDIYQESFIRVYKGLGKFEQKSEFTTWLYRIVTNVCLTYKEKKRRTSMSSLDDDDEGGLTQQAVSDNASDARANGNEIINRIESALQLLSAQQRLVFTLRHYQEYKVREIAEMMQCAEGTIKKYLFEATQKMKSQLHDLYE